MSSLLRFLSSIVIGLAFTLWAPLTLADSPSQGEGHIQASEIQGQLDALPARNLPEQESVAAKNYLQQALQFVDQRDRDQEKLQKLNADIKEAPKRIAEYKSQLEQLTQQKVDETEAIKEAQSQNDAELQLYYVDQNTQLDAMKAELLELNKVLLQAQTQPEQTQIALSALERRRQALSVQTDRELSKEEGLSNQAEQQAIMVQLSLLRQELNSNVLLEVKTLRKKILELQVEHRSAHIDALQKVIEERRQAATEEAVRSAEQVSSEMPTNDLLQQEKDLNRELADHLQQSSVALNQYTQQNNVLAGQLEVVKQIDGVLTQQIKVLRGSASLFELLYQQKKNLPKTSQSREKMVNQLGELRLNQFYLSQARNAFVDPRTHVKSLLSGQEQMVDEETEQNLLELAKVREELYNSLQNNLSQLISVIVNVQIAQKQLDTKTKEVNQVIDEQMFWTPSTQPIGLSWFRLNPNQIQGESAVISASHRLTDAAKTLVQRPWFFTPLILLIFFLLLKRKRIQAAIATINANIGNVAKDMQKNTPLVLLFDVLLALPVTLALVLAGMALVTEGQEINVHYGQALLSLALGWFVFNVIYLVLSPNNIAIEHFDVTVERAKKLRRRTTLLGALVLVMMVMMSVSNNQWDNILRNHVYIIATLLCYPLLSYLLAKMLSAYKQDYRNFKLFDWVLSITLVATPLVLMVATMAGYYFTVVQITLHLIDTLYLILLWALLDGLAVRWLKVAARRLAYQRAMEKRQALLQLREQEQSSEDLPPIIEEPTLDMETINQQSLKVIRMFLTGGVAVMLYLIWANVLAVFNYLDGITIYHYFNAEHKLTALTLMGLIVAVMVFLVMVLLVRNLPGLLEIFVLSRLRLSKGVSYAITTLLAYVLIALGVGASLSILGVSWNKLQWLVAALSVGLGFGLQEIFANFISGIIVLFERPIRIGDVVTVDGVTGTVKQINIRATQLLEADGKDVVIPNKTFVTGKLTNWTLSNTMTRITLTIGVAYDSDIERVKQLLLQIARGNPRVTKEPTPSVSVVQFSADSVDLNLYMFVNATADRIPATDEVHSKILEVFAQENIEIPFHQIDVTLKNGVNV